MLRWFLALLLVPFLDAVFLAVIVTQFGLLGWIQMVLLVVLTGLVGMLLVRAEGRRTIRKIQRSLAEGRPPTDELLDGALLIAAGAFLLTPGFVTDLLGFLLVVPPTRIPIRAGIKRFVVVPALDRRTDGLASGAVWTFGFPDANPGGGGEPGPAGGADDRSVDVGTDDGMVDLGSDEYSVDDDSYTIDFADEDDEDDEADSDGVGAGSAR